MNKPLFAIVLAGLAAAGAAIALTLAPNAAAWDWHSLPSGYGVASSYTTICHIATDPCVGGEGSICTHLIINSVAGSFTETDCVYPTFQADLDAWVNATICTVNPAAGGAACQPQTTEAAPPPPTTDTGTTTTGPAPPPATPTEPSTTTTPRSPPPPPDTTTAAATTTSAGTTTASTVDDALSALDARVAALEQQLAALTSRVERLELAVEASQLAFEQRLAAGDDVAAAAAIARGTYLNAVYGLGEFAA